MAVQLPPNSTGTVVDTVTLSGADRQVVTLGDAATAGNKLAVNADGSLNTDPDETTTGNITAASGFAQTASGAFITNALNANSSVTLAVNGNGTVNIFFTANNSTNTLVFEGSPDGGTNWTPVNVNAAGFGGAVQASSAVTFAGRINAASITHVRVRSTNSFSAETVAVTLRAAKPSGLITIAEPSQELKDANRTVISYYTEAYSVTASEALVPITGVQRGSAASSTSQLTVTSGKTLRIQNIFGSITLLGTTVANTRIRLRGNMSGAALVTSPIYLSWRTGNWSIGTQAANYVVQPFDIDIADGLEFPAGTGLQFTAIASTAAMHSLDLNLVGFEY